MIDHEKFLSDTLKDIKPSGIRKFFDLLADMGDVTALTVGQPDFVTPWHIREAAIQSLERGHTYYTSNSGLPELRREVCSYMSRRFDLEYAPEEVLITVGGSEAIDVAVRSLVNPGDEVTALGGSGKYAITPDDWAALKGTHAYDIICSFGNRVERVYVNR